MKMISKTVESYTFSIVEEVPQVYTINRRIRKAYASGQLARYGFYLDHWLERVRVFKPVTNIRITRSM